VRSRGSWGAGRIRDLEIGDAGLDARQATQPDRPRGCRSRRGAPAARRPRRAARPPDRPVPAPLATTGVEWRRQARRTSSPDPRSGAAPRSRAGGGVGGERVALEGCAGFRREAARLRRRRRREARDQCGGQASRVNVTTPVDVPTSQHIRGRRANSPTGHHARDLVDLALEATGSGMWRATHVEDVVAVVGNEALAPHGLAAEPRELAATWLRAMGSPHRQRGNGRVARRAYARPRCRRSDARPRPRSSRA